MTIKNIGKKQALLALLILLIGTVLFRFTIAPEAKNLQNLDATLHTLLTIEAASEAPLSVSKFLPIVTLDNPINKFVNWGGAKFDKSGNGIYTSFPPLGFIVPYIFMAALDLPASINSLFFFNILLQLATVLLAYQLAQSIAERLELDDLAVNLSAFLATVPYIFSPEALYSHGYVYWGHSLFQVFFLSYFVVISEATKLDRAVTTARYIGIFILLTLMCLTDWSGYLVAASVPFATLFLPSTPVARKRVLSLLAIGSAITAGTLMISAFSWVVGFDVFVAALKNRFFARNFNANIPLGDLFVAYGSSYGLFLVFIPMGIISIFILRKRKDLVLPNFLLVLTLAAIVENFLMKQHAIEYHYDRLKLLLLFTIAVPLLWALQKRVLKIVIAIVTVVAAGLSMASYKADRFFADIDVVSNTKYLTLNTDDGFLATSHQVRGFLTLMFHRNVMQDISIDRARQLALLKSYPVYWIDGIGLQNLVVQITGIYRFSSDGSIQHYSGLTCSERLQNLVSMSVTNCSKSDALFLRSIAIRNVSLDAIDIKSKALQPYDLTDATWLGGVGRASLGVVFFVENSEIARDVYLSSGKYFNVRFADGEVRKILSAREAGEFINVYLDGPPLDAKNVGRPQSIKLLKI